MSNNKNISKDGKKTQFSKARQPKNNGRKPHLMTDTIRALETAGFKAVGREEIIKVWAIFLNLPEDKVREVVNDGQRPMAERIIAKQLMGPKGYEAIEALQDRVFGKSQSNIDITTGGEKIDTVDYSKLDEKTLRNILAARIGSDKGKAGTGK